MANNNSREALQAKISEGIQNLLNAMDTAIGKTAPYRALFYGFGVHPDVKGVVARTIEHFGSGELNHAEAGLMQSVGRFDRHKRSFCARMPEKLFEPMFLALPHLDEALESQIKAQKEEFALLAAEIGVGKGDLEVASEKSWALRDAMLRAPREQAERDAVNAHQRVVEKVKKRKKRDQDQADQARQVADQRAEQRASLADQFAQQLGM